MNMQFKKIKKVIFTFIILFLIIFTINAIINKENNEKIEINEKKDKNKIISKEKNYYYIAISQCNFAEPWRTEMNRRYKKAAEKYPEFKLVLLDGMQDNNKQISDIEYFISQKCDMLIVSPNEAKPLTAVIDKAYNSGIPVILVDRRTESKLYTQYIGADNFKIGQMAGQWASSYFGERGGNIIEIRGTLGTSAQKERHEGFLSGIENNSNIKIIDSGNSDWMFDKAIASMEDFLVKYNKIDLVYAHNDPMAEGAYKAAKNAGREGEMKFIGIDALPTKQGGIMSVMEGRIDVTYLYPSGAEQVIENAYSYLVKGIPLKKEVTLDTIEITNENAESIYKELNK